MFRSARAHSISGDDLATIGPSRPRRALAIRRLAPYNLERSRDPETTRVNATFVIFGTPARPVRTLFSRWPPLQVDDNGVVQ